MAVDLFALRMNLQTTGIPQAMGALHGLDTQGQKTAAALGGAAGSMGKVSVAARTGEAAALAATSRFGALGGVVGALGPIGIATGVAFLGLTTIIRATAPEADAFRISTLRLDGAARLTGVSLSFLQRISKETQDRFKLSSVQTNELTAEISKLTGKAGDISKTGAVLAAFLNIGAAQGMSAQQTLIAVHQAILGIDEGTDKLFQKNPSVIYKEFAAEIGTTAGKLTDQQKAQALVNEAMEASLKVGDAYGRFLETAVGQQSQLATASERLQVAIGKLFEPFRAFVAGSGTTFLNWLADVVEGLESVTGRLANLATPGLGLAGTLGVLLGGGGADTSSDWDAGDTAFDGVQRGGSSTATPRAPGKPISAAERERRARALERRLLGILDATAPDTLPGGGGLGGSIGTRDDRIDVSGSLTAPAMVGGRRGQSGIFEELLRQGETVRKQFQMLGTSLGMTLANGFSSAMGAAMQGKNPFKAFGNAILSGLGSIFTQMGSELLAYGVIMLNLLPFLSNPFTSGFAAIAAGAALVALGSALGGIATGPGGGGGGGGGASRDRTTQITLTADGAGGFHAPKRDAGPTFTVIGASDPRSHRIIGDIQKGASRRNIG